MQKSDWEHCLEGTDLSEEKKSTCPIARSRLTWSGYRGLPDS